MPFAYAARQSGRSNVTTPMRGCVVAAHCEFAGQREPAHFCEERYDASRAPTRSRLSWDGAHRLVSAAKTPAPVLAVGKPSTSGTPLAMRQCAKEPAAPDVKLTTTSMRLSLVKASQALASCCSRGSLDDASMAK